MTARIAALLAGTLLVAACSSATTSTPAAPGATVTVTNSDGAEHIVTADSGNAFNVEVGGKGTATFTAPSQPGRYPFHGAYHPVMHGQLIVR